jgi:hypothetical protein
MSARAREMTWGVPSDFALASAGRSVSGASRSSDDGESAEASSVHVSRGSGMTDQRLLRG